MLQIITAISFSSNNVKIKTFEWPFNKGENIELDIKNINCSIKNILGFKGVLVIDFIINDNTKTIYFISEFFNEADEIRKKFIY